MDGFIIINKPKGMTSHDVCGKLRGILHTKKIGHSGTLDPLATGVLVVGVGKATKLLNYLENHEKTYEAEVLLGLKTDSYDILGNVIKKDDNFLPNVKQIDETLEKLKYTKTQIPPIYSSIKVNGKKLYEYARNGEKVEILPRAINIYSLERISDIIDKKVKIKVHADKGFYVRSLVNDLGEVLGGCATMKELTRIKAGDFSISESQTFDDIIENGPKIISIEEMFRNLKKIDVNDYMKKLVLNGVILDHRQFNDNEMFKVYHNEKLIALYEPVGEKKYKLVIKLED